MARSPITKIVADQVMTACRRHCCLCVFLDGRDEVRRGQIAHLNRNANDSRFENLVYLCLEHHNEYDSTARQSRGYTETEVRHWRDTLYNRYPKSEALKSDTLTKVEEPKEFSTVSSYDKIINRTSNGLSFLAKPWRYPLWQVGNVPDLFAYKARSGFDGVCLVERINLPDGRIVISCVQVPGNPGRAITNCVEEICLQVCERFEIPADKLVWLEHFDTLSPKEWYHVTFGVAPPKGPFANPKWTQMTDGMWKALKLRPKTRMRIAGGQYESKLRKLFYWPFEPVHD